MMTSSSRFLWQFATCITFTVLFGSPSFVKGGWVDPDTPESKRKTRSFVGGDILDLVMSDEFNRDGRTFTDGHDPMWTAIQRSDDDQTSTGQKSLQFYNSSFVYTQGGKLVIKTTTDDASWKGYNPYKKKYVKFMRHFQSGMLQSWNKFCFTGGVLEVDLTFPGKPDIGGLWPAVWLLGNLGRATFEASTNLIWPWSSPKCDRKLQKAQEISGCDTTGHFDMEPSMGRGATEIDIVEVMPGKPGALPIVHNGVQRPYNSMTLQLAPGVPPSKKRPQFFTLPEWPGFTWYKNLTYGPDTSVNPFFYGAYLGPTTKQEPVKRTAAQSYQYDALSALASLPYSFWEGVHTFRIEWQPGDKGYLNWYIDGVLKYGIEQSSLDFMGTKIPNEPSTIIMNTAISTSWGFPALPPGCGAGATTAYSMYDCKTTAGRCGLPPGFCATLPAEFHIDNVRLYQRVNDSSHTIGCDPKGFPTSKFIAAHPERYISTSSGKPLLPIEHGGGKCVVNAPAGSPGANSKHVCGGAYGTGHCDAKKRKCVCNEEWTGPYCLSPRRFYEEESYYHETSATVLLEEMDRILLSPVMMGYFVAFATAFVALAFSVAVRAYSGRKHVVFRPSPWL